MKKKKVVLTSGIAMVVAGAVIVGVNLSKKSSEEGNFTGKADIVLNKTSISANEKSVTVEGTKATITAGGSYSVSGEIENGRIVVDAGTDDVTIVLDGASILSDEKDAIYVESAGSLTIELADGKENILSTGSEEDYQVAKEASKETETTDSSESKTQEESTEAESTEAESTEEETTSSEEDGLKNSEKAALMAKCDLTISGSGSLEVKGYTNNGIQSKNNLTVESGVITVVAANDAVKANENLSIQSGSVTVDAYGDAITADGDLSIADGSFTITTGGGAKNASSKSQMGGGFQGGTQNKTMEKSSGEESTGKSDTEEESQQANGGQMPGDGQMPSAEVQTNESGEEETKGQMGGNRQGGFRFDDSSDADDSNQVSQKGMKAGGNMTISGGSFSLDTVDDSLHSDGDVTVSGGTFTIDAGDDGMHAGGTLTYEDGATTVKGCYEGVEGTVIVVNGGTLDLTADDDGFNAASDTTDPNLTINGGEITIDSEGDGLDSNKDLIINGGNIYIDGPSNGGNAALDCGSENQGKLQINGGTLYAIGMSSMLENPDSSSSQQSISYVFDSTVSKDTEVVITDSEGNEIAKFTPSKDADCIVFSSPDLKTGETYTFTYGDKEESFEASEINASNKTGGMGMGGQMGGQMGGNRQGGFGGRQNPNDTSSDTKEEETTERTA